MASYACPRFTRSLQAAADLSAKQFYYVGDNGSGKTNIVGGIQGAVGFGFLQNKPLADEFCEIAANGGGSKAVAGTTISAAKLPLKANALGKLVPAVAGDIVVAISMEAAAVDDIFEVNPILYIAGSTPVIFASAADLTSGQYLYVGDSSGDIDVVGGATGALGYGFLMNAPDTGENAIINGPGYPYAKGISGAAFSIMTELMANANGKLIATTAAGDIVCALSLAAATGADETIDVIPVLYRKHA